MVAGGAVVGGDSREVSDVLVEDAPAAGDRRTEYLGVGTAGEPEIWDRQRVGLGGLERFGQRRRVHLVEYGLHRASAAAVSLR